MRLLIVAAMLLSSTSSVIAEERPRPVTLLLQGVGVIGDEHAAEKTWGALVADEDARLRWDGFLGYVTRESQLTIGGVIRPRSERVTDRDIDSLGAGITPRPDIYLLASSADTRSTGLLGRARELAATVTMLHRLTRRPIRLVAYSASGVAARIWIQGLLPQLPFVEGVVSELITVATPHQGIGGFVSTASRAFDLYKPLIAESDLLEKLNGDCVLPKSVQFKSLYFAVTDASIDLPTGRNYQLNLTAEALERLPRIMRGGHDGCVDTLSAQLHLTRSGARYEHWNQACIESIPCVLLKRTNRTNSSVTAHVAGISDPHFQSILLNLLKADSNQSDAELQQDRWLTELALFYAARAIRRKMPTATFRTEPKISVSQSVRSGWWIWSYQSEIWIPQLFGDSRLETVSLTGSFELQFNALGRPDSIKNINVEF